MSAAEVGGYSGAVYGWPGEGSEGAHANVQFENGQVIGKAQSGIG